MPKKHKKAKKKSKSNIEIKEEKEEKIEKEIIVPDTPKTETEVNQINDNNENENDNDKDTIIKAFEYFDINHNGKINISDLTNALSTFGEVMTQEEMKNIFESAGIVLDYKEEIDYIKFVDFWLGNN